jgi:hypothetical protein
MPLSGGRDPRGDLLRTADEGQRRRSGRVKLTESRAGSGVDVTARLFTPLFALLMVGCSSRFSLAVRLLLIRKARAMAHPIMLTNASP